MQRNTHQEKGYSGAGIEDIREGKGFPGVIGLSVGYFPFRELGPRNAIF